MCPLRQVIYIQRIAFSVQNPDMQCVSAKYRRTVRGCLTNVAASTNMQNADGFQFESVCERNTDMQFVGEHANNI